ncbi:hypothetical protein SAMN04489760_14811 [Syntrophus gentianae]|uniref:Uncharacterized protein n=1 Tax=Syntrophus gentianae TaxID=43775 RepID=A0A1H8B8J9_9BACT|nr:hypothetical protein [Syntrophus gentianae]SEM79016.1 hypothetical protein SAMN04489760_14811 [Syntrophus gentianae]
MGIKEDMAAALPEMFEVLGEPATFSPSGGTPAACHILIDFNVDLQPDGFQSTAWQRSTVIEAVLSDIGSEPNRGDVFRYNGMDYTVQKVTFNDGLSVKVAVTP